MPNTTENYGLIKPLESEFYDIGVFNDNADKIDRSLADIRASANLANAAIQELLNSNLGTARLDITIPAGNWEADTVYPYHCDIANEQITADTTPMLTILPESMATAQDCAMAPCAQTLDGVLRVYAETIPTAPIQASVTLLGVSPYSGGSSGGTTGGVADYVTTEQLNTAVDAALDNLLDSKTATEDEVNEMLDEVFAAQGPSA